jgi:hypothetical protein
MADVTGSYVANLYGSVLSVPTTFNQSIFKGATQVSGSALGISPVILHNTIVSVSSTIVVVSGSGGGTFAYLLRGYYPTGNAFEFWLGSTPQTSPPSGHVLIDTTIIQKLSS